MRRLIVVGLVLAALFAAAIVTTGISSDTRSQDVLGVDRSFAFEYQFTIKEISSDAKTAEAWIPLPQSGEHQTISNLRVPDDSWHESVVEKENGNTFLHFRWDKRAINGGELTVAVRYDVERKPRRSTKAPHANMQTASSLAPFLEPDGLVPSHGPIAEEALRVAGDHAGPMEKARALYDHIVETVRYDKSGEGWGRGDALYACDTRMGNCTDFHSLFIGEARALKIPARFVMGFPIPEDKDQGEIGGYHCWAEFHVDGVGWLPIDASEAHRHPHKREAFFGGLDANRVALTLGRDIELPNAKTAALNYVIYPHVEIDGVAYDNVSTQFSFREIKRAD